MVIREGHLYKHTAGAEYVVVGITKEIVLGLAVDAQGMTWTQKFYRDYFEVEFTPMFSLPRIYHCN